MLLASARKFEEQSPIRTSQFHLKSLDIKTPKHYLEKRKDVAMNYKILENRLIEVIDDKIELTEKLIQITKILAEEISYYNWVGFYLVEGDDILVLGPYVGDYTDHTHIPFGKGVCGQVALRQETAIIPDVNALDNYLACSINVRSEIVVPIFNKQGRFVGEIDIDSHTIDVFTEQDKLLLENIADKLSEYFD
jgi:GAF domain-containing protein